MRSTFAIPIGLSAINRATQIATITRMEAVFINPETTLQNKIIVALCQNGCVARNHTVGQFYTKYGSIVNIGHHGQADVWGHRKSDGRAIYIEVKLPGEEPREDQQKFLDAMQRAGALSGCAHSIEEALQIVRR